MFGKQPVEEVEKSCMHRLTILYEITEVDVLDSARHAVEDGR